jgi:hypothetical protein
MIMRTRSISGLWLSGALLFAVGCSESHPGDEPTGRLAAALQFPPVVHDVQAVRLDVVAGGGSCADPPLDSKTIPLESAPLPATTAGPGSGMHQFAHGLFVLAPGSYLVCATPLGAAGPSAECAPTQGTIEVVADQTAALLLVSQCQGTASGGADVVVALNNPPKITALDAAPSGFITTCQSAALSVTASDPDGDTLSYAWAVLSGPAGATLHAADATATFFGPAGDYLLGVTVTDAHTATATLSFPLRVSAATCAVPQAVQAIFNARCFSCHIANSAGGLSLATPETAYANLVGVHALGAGCMDRVRVIAGDAAGSYLIAKLRNIPPICGLPMPRNRPPLPEEEIATIETWINGLPH